MEWIVVAALVLFGVGAAVAVYLARRDPLTRDLNLGGAGLFTLGRTWLRPRRDEDAEDDAAGKEAREDRAEGAALHILTLSRGAAGGDINVRTAEAQRAAQILDASLTFGNLPDRHISDGVE